MESYSNIFKKQIPIIGIDRKLRLLSLSKEDSLNQSSPPNTLSQEICEQMSCDNVAKYKTSGCPMAYTSEDNTSCNNIITYNRLVDILQNDPNVYENFITKDKGTWIKDEESPLFKKDEDNLIIDSQFESGNLRYAIQVNPDEYDLVIRKDYNSEKNYSWFFFMIKSSKARVIKMNILNLIKKSILFSDKIRVLRYTDNDHWNRNTFNVYYFDNGIPMPIIDNGAIEDKDKLSMNNVFNTITNTLDIPNTQNTQIISENNNKKTVFSTLTFSYEISQNEINCPIYFAYCYPYTYSSLQNYLYNLSLNSSFLKAIRFNVIGETLCNNNLNIIYITCFNEDIGLIHKRPIIVFTARVHPGESNSSYIIEGVINALLSNEFSDLRKKYMFKIIPMLNPDGVINGNYRSCIIGKDLNRMWQDPRENTTPTILTTKNLIISSKPDFYCDFHGHSSCSNATLYGCSPKKSKKGNNLSNPNFKSKKQYHHLEERVFMKIFEETSKFYEKSNSRFTISKMKAKTARAVVYSELNVIYSYCLETSTMSTYKNDVYEPFTIDKYYQVGKDFVICLNKMMTQKNIFFTTLKKVRTDEEERIREKDKAKEKKESSIVFILNKKPQKRNNKSNLLKDLSLFSLHHTVKPEEMNLDNKNMSTISSNKSSQNINHFNNEMIKKEKGEQDKEKEESNNSSSSYLTD